MLEGINITREAQEGNAIYGRKELLDSVFSRYQIWKSNIKDFLVDTNINTIEWYKFYEADSVPSLKGGPEYADIQSDKSQMLLKNIRIETSKTLALFKQVGDFIFGNKLPKTKITDQNIIELKNKNGKTKFRFNFVTGDTELNTTTFNFSYGTQKFILLKTILLANEHQAFYNEICKNLNLDEGKVSNRHIQQLIKEIKEDLRIIPKGKKSGPDIFFVIPKKGYRIKV